jgi:hypothetical protein
VELQRDAECVRLATERVGCTMMFGERLVMAGMEVVTRAVSDDREVGRKTAAGFLAFYGGDFDQYFH